MEIRREKNNFFAEKLRPCLVVVKVQFSRENPINFDA